MSEWRTARGPTEAITFDWATQSLVDPLSAGDAPVSEITVYQNACPGTATPTWEGLDPCDILYDQGVIPGTTNPKAGFGATDTNLISEFTFDYCTTHVGDDVEIEILFWEDGNLLGGASPPAPSTALSRYRLTGLKGLAPGQTESCYSVTVDLGFEPFCMISDGNGTWQNSESTDPFTWAFISYTGAADTGPLLAGNPAFGSKGDCTYSNPCGSGCGTGLATPDFYMLDKLSPGCATGKTPALYWYGGIVLASFAMELKSYGDCSTCIGAPLETYCTAGTSASGCQALISATGTPSATDATGFSLETTGVEGNKDGLYFFGTNGRQANTWGSGTSFQCVVPSVKRAGLLVGSGTVGVCDGSFSQDLNARWTAKPAQNPGAGAVVQAQLWYRDPFNTSNQTTSLSDALEFVVCP